MSTSGGTVSSMIEAATAALDEAGVEGARLDAELLLAAAREVGREQLYLDPDAQLEPAARRKFAALVRRRCKREPVAYILGEAYFRNLKLTVTRATLIPRPETELLVEQARDGERVLDVGSGCGAVALAIAAEREDVRVTATDNSGEALEVARLNTARLGLSVSFIEADLVADGHFDLLVSNPPYVCDGQWPELQPEITSYEPRSALLAGPDGLDVIKRLVKLAPTVLVPRGRIALEVGAGQAEAVKALMSERGFSRIGLIPDLAGINRVVSAQWSNQ